MLAAGVDGLRRGREDGRGGRTVDFCAVEAEWVSAGVDGLRGMGIIWIRVRRRGRVAPAAKKGRYLIVRAASLPIAAAIVDL